MDLHPVQMVAPALHPILAHAGLAGQVPDVQQVWLAIWVEV